MAHVCPESDWLVHLNKKKKKNIFPSAKWLNPLSTLSVMVRITVVIKASLKTFCLWNKIKVINIFYMVLWSLISKDHRMNKMIFKLCDAETSELTGMDKCMHTCTKIFFFITGIMAVLCWPVRCPAGCVDSKLGRDVTAHLLSFFKELQRDTGEEGDHREGGREAKKKKKNHPILQLVSKALLLEPVSLRTQM